MIRLKVAPGIALLGMVLVSQSALAGNCSGTYCSVSYGGLFDTLCDADCSTYTETVVTSPISGSAVQHTELLFTIRRINCDSKPSTIDMSYSYTNSESMSHTGTGALKNQVTGKVGQKDVYEVGLQHAVENATTKIWTTSFSQTINVNYKPTVPPCTAQKLKLFVVYKTGEFSGTGHVAWSVTGRWCFTLNYVTVSGTCASTSSSVSSSHRRYIQVSPVNSTEAAAPGECQEGCGPVTEEVNPTDPGLE